MEDIEISSDTLSRLVSQRKILEKDFQVLSNRLVFLKQENNRTLNNVARTKAKAVQIVRNKQRLLSKSNERSLKFLQNKTQHLQRLRNLKERRLSLLHGTRKSKSDLRSRLSRNASEIKRITKHNELVIQNQASRYLAMNRNKSQSIRSQRSLSSRRSVDSERKLKVKNLKKSKMQNELSLLRLKKKHVRDLENTELQLIEKLKNSQNNAHAAIQDLERARTAPIEIINTQITS